MAFQKSDLRAADQSGTDESGTDQSGKDEVPDYEVQIDEEDAGGIFKEQAPDIQQDYRKKIPSRTAAKESILEEFASEDKWEQLQRCYKTVHPFGDERVFLSVEPKDFIILRAPYQRLVNNSFLLHGFYNYRHMILGPDKEIGEGDGTCFYLGVPGTYFEREKMVAIMFGFEGFECGGPVEVGKFGYYMRKVEL
ncbi:MAG: hypothetical protein K2G39_11985 [Lachnospiraceae bacterium]|nr:hypothetical protein [Lachnospiraceae bacterium]